MDKTPTQISVSLPAWMIERIREIQSRHPTANSLSGTLVVLLGKLPEFENPGNGRRRPGHGSLRP